LPVDIKGALQFGAARVRCGELGDVAEFGVFDAGVREAIGCVVGVLFFAAATFGRAFFFEIGFVGREARAVCGVDPLSRTV
jgi:hypothetical protein